jgi:hypothetical protein
MDFRTIAAGAALAALSLTAIPAHACSDRYQSGCAAQVQAEEPGPAVNIKPAPRVKGTPRVRAPKPTQTARAEKHKKSRVARVRYSHRVAALPERKIPAPVPSASTRTETTAARRFRNFIDPQSFSLNTAEELRQPRPSAVHLAGEVADPSIVPAAWTPSLPAADPVAQALVTAPEQANGDDRATPAPVVAQSDVAEVRRAAPDGDHSRMSFMSWFFIAWGGVLTVASALRLVVG